MVSLPPRHRRQRPFRFLDLPLELRREVYHHHLALPRTVDLGDSAVAPRLWLFRTCRQIHEEAFPVFYGSNTFRLFSTHGKYFRRSRKLLTRLSPRYRAALTKLELRLGPGWAAPPPSWQVQPRLGLDQAISIRTLYVFVECDPTHEAFRGFRQNKDFFTAFATRLLQDVILELRSLKEIRFDAYPSVLKEGPLMQSLALRARSLQRPIFFSPSLEQATQEPDGTSV